MKALFEIGVKMIFIVIMLVFIFLFILLTILSLPGMALFNKFSDQRYQADEKELLTGILTTAILSTEATGEVVTNFVNESRKTMPAKIFHSSQESVHSIAKGTEVLIIETKLGIAYVIPYQQTLIS